MEEILLPPEYLYEQLMKRKAELARCQRERDVLAEELKASKKLLAEIAVALEFHEPNHPLLDRVEAALAMLDDENKS